MYKAFISAASRFAFPLRLPFFPYFPSLIFPFGSKLENHHHSHHHSYILLFTSQNSITPLFVTWQARNSQKPLSSQLSLVYQLVQKKFTPWCGASCRAVMICMLTPPQPECRLHLNSMTQKEQTTTTPQVMGTFSQQTLNMRTSRITPEYSSESWPKVLKPKLWKRYRRCR
jgi:hypothetical protein